MCQSPFQLEVLGTTGCEEKKYLMFSSPWERLNLTCAWYTGFKESGELLGMGGNDFKFSVVRKGRRKCIWVNP